MSPVGPWVKRHADLAKQYAVNSLILFDLSLRDHENVDFLLDLPPLRDVSIVLSHPKDLSALAHLRHLTSLRLRFGLTGWRLGEQLKPVDFTSLRRLRHVDVMLCRPFESILRCRTIEELAISNTCDGRLRDLDLTHIPGLRDLSLDHCPKLRSVALHPRAKVRALELSLCGSYQIDWARIGPTLQYLLLGGRLSFRLEDILKAPKLKELHAWEIRKLPPLGFLRGLPNLECVDLFAAPPRLKLSEEDRALIREINARGTQRSR